MSLAYLRYHTGLHESTDMAPFIGIVSVKAYKVRGEHDLGRAMGEPQDLARHLSELHSKLLSRSTKTQLNAARLYDSAMNTFEETRECFIY